MNIISCFQTMANTLGLYVQNLLAIDACGTLRDEAHRLLTKQVRRIEFGIKIHCVNNQANVESCS